MSNTELADFRDALRTAIVDDTALVAELTKNAVVKAPANAQPEDISTAVLTTAAKSKGLAVVLYNGAGRNLDPDGGDIALETLQHVELYVHRVKWNKKHDSSKRTAEVLMLSLIKLLHNAEISIGALKAYEKLQFREFNPLQDEEFEVWELTFARVMIL